MNRDMRNNFFGLLLLLLSSGLVHASIDSLAMKHALEKSMHYFEMKGLSLQRTDVVMIQSILSRRFQLQMNTPSDSAFVAKDNKFAHCYFKMYDIAYRNCQKIEEADSITVLQTFRAQLSKLDMRTAWSMYADRYPISDSFVDLLEEGSIDPYAITHKAFQTQVLLSNARLSSSQYHRLNTLKLNLIPALEKVVVDSSLTKYENDIRIEAMVMLAFLNEKSRIKEESINYLLHSQAENGGWKASITDTQTNEHTSVLALWFLCEYLFQ